MTDHKTSPPLLHPRNPHQGRYDFEALISTLPELEQHTTLNPDGEPTINFADNDAVVALNKALLAHHYDVRFWDLPQGYLCPPIPGRADYLHYIADLLTEAHDGKIPKGKQIHALDIGTGANCIYPIIGSQSYGWKFTTTDIDPVSVSTAKTICEANTNLKPLIKIKQQKQADQIFHGIIGQHDYFDITLCNPPFHASLDEAIAANQRKQQNLKNNRSKRNQHKRHHTHVSQTKQQLNFGGQKAELWCEGGEIAFLKRMAYESNEFTQQVGWFTSLVSKSENVNPLEQLLKKLGAKQITITPMRHGQKTTRILAWRF